MNIDTEYGVFPGRFQPYHNGHHRTLSKYFSVYKAPLIIGIIINKLPVDFNTNEISDFDLVAEQHHLEEKNPFSFWERYKMISSIWANEITNGQIILLPLPRPQGPPKWWQFVIEFLPPKRFWVIPTSTDDFDEQKNKYYLSVGEKVVRIGDSKELSGEKIRTLIREKQSIKGLVPASIEHLISEES
jgi:nicotinamide mononucleotide adenylyltransferase